MQPNVELLQDIGKHIILVSRIEALLGFTGDKYTINPLFRQADKGIELLVETQGPTGAVNFTVELSVSIHSAIIQRLINGQGMYMIYDDLKKMGYLPGDFGCEAKIKNAIKKDGGLYIARLSIEVIEKMKLYLKSL